MRRLGLAALQIDAEASGNFDLVEKEIRSVVKRFPWLRLVAVGELIVHGPSTEKAEPAGGPTEKRFQALARDLDIWLVPGSMYEARGGQVYNMAPVIAPDGTIVSRYDKMFPFRPYEASVASGSGYCVFDIPGIGRIGLVICYDIWFPEVIRTLSAMGAEVILAPTLTNTIDRDVEIAIARANAATSQVYMVAVNGTGKLGNGRSVVFGPGGELIYEAGTGRDVIALELDLDQVAQVRERGWHGLGQVMKSFRDSSVSFPLHASTAQRQEALSGLGELAVPERESPASQSIPHSSKPTDDRPQANGRSGRD